MKLAGVVLLLMILSACAVVEDRSVVSNKSDRLAAIKIDSSNVEHGIVTVKKVFPRSDIVIQPPSNEHVVWQRSVVVQVIAEDKNKVDNKKSSVKNPSNIKIVKNTNNVEVLDRWPLLAIDLDFDTEIRKLDMCQTNDKDCMSHSCNKMLEPCENASLYNCHSAKPGDYCLENRP